VNGAPENGAVSLYMDAVEIAFIPGVDMTAEDAGCIPFFKLLQKEERLFPRTDDENQ